jgi:KaiC/GvpD/RAD55 family RecA-like ATPase
MQYIYNGAKKGEAGIYITLDERASLLREDMKRFGWDLEALEEQGLLSIIDGAVAKIGMPSEERISLPPTGFDLDKLILEIMRVAKKINAKRCAIDSIPALGFNFDSVNEVRKAVLKLSFMLMRTGLTSIVISEIEEGSRTFGRYGVEEFVSDGVIVLHYMGTGTQSNRTLHIRKLRATKHSEDLHPIEITPKGIRVRKIEEEFTKI